MNVQIDSIAAKGRFAALLRGRSHGADLHDQPLLETKNWVVAPTLGAIVPNWLIVVPRQPSLNYKSWQCITGHDPTAIVADVAAHLGLPIEQLLWFEHGPRDIGTVVGCGVDYAHLHILFDPKFTFDALMDRIQTSTSLTWRSCEAHLAYAGLSGDHSYLVAGCGDRAFFSECVETTGSQFLRRMVAATAGLDSDWDYKCYPHHENIALTVTAFRVLAHAAASCG